jgi:hypothetical protein
MIENNNVLILHQPRRGMNRTFSNQHKDSTKATPVNPKTLGNIFQ